MLANEYHNVREDLLLMFRGGREPQTADDLEGILFDNSGRDGLVTLEFVEGVHEPPQVVYADT